MQQKNTIVGLDIGTTKICVIVGKLSNEKIDIIGIGIHPSVGLKKGVVVNIESTVESIKKAITEAELMAGCKISSAYVGISGGHVNGFNSHGIVAVKGNDITKTDIDRVIKTARTLVIPLDREILHVLPQEYIVDGQIGIQNPLGMAGIRLEAKIHIVTGSRASTHNLIKCVNKAGLNIRNIVLKSLASSEAVLTSEEKELGTAFIDLGGGTSDLAIFKNKSIRHTFVLPLGGDNLTKDVAIGIRTPLKNAEKIKKEFGTCNRSLYNSDKMMDVQKIGRKELRQIPCLTLSKIIEPRIEEIFFLLAREIHQISENDNMISGIVLSGGTSHLNGIIDVAKSIFEVPIRIGKPMGIDSLKDELKNPAYATSIGLLVYGTNQIREKTSDSIVRSGFKNLISSIKKWFVDIV